MEPSSAENFAVTLFCLRWNGGKSVKAIITNVAVFGVVLQHRGLRDLIGNLFWRPNFELCTVHATRDFCTSPASNAFQTKSFSIHYRLPTKLAARKLYASGIQMSYDKKKLFPTGFCVYDECVA